MGGIHVARIIERVFVAAATAALIRTVGPPTRADEAAGEAHRGGTLEEIVVTARKRVESAQVAPVAVSAISAADIEAAHLSRLDDLSALAPNLTVTENTSAVGWRR
jgi:outer membrane cobalamin receptor